MAGATSVATFATVFLTIAVTLAVAFLAVILLEEKPLEEAQPGQRAPLARWPRQGFPCATAGS